MPFTPVLYNFDLPNQVRYNQATGMTKISRGGVFSKIFRPGGGILPEVLNFDRKSRFLALLSHN